VLSGTCLGCRCSVPAWKRLCDSCWRLLPFARRLAITDARRARAPHLVASLSIDAARWLETNRPADLAARRIGEAAE
jgi:hypothetical protein